MKYSNVNNSSSPRKQQATISSTLVRCVCVTASCIATACGLLGLGVTCFAVRLADPSSAPCPFLMTLTVFAAAGLLFLVSFVSLLAICRRRHRRRDLLEDLPPVEEEERKAVCDGAADQAENNGKVKEKAAEETAVIHPEEPASPEDNFEMTQKSADVSLWIEQQKSTEEIADCYLLETREGATSHDSDGEGSEPEITPL